MILLLLTLIWGSSFILIKRGLDHFDAGEVGALRMFSASIVLFPLAIKWFVEDRLKMGQYGVELDGKLLDGPVQLDSVNDQEFK